jgi:hypothetical protein
MVGERVINVMIIRIEILLKVRGRRESVGG